MECKTIKVEWQDINLSVTLGKKKNAFQKQILSDVNGATHPGDLMAIMGPSGAGKTSLLNCLACRTRPDSGVILFNGMPMQPAQKRRIAYVHQQEMLLKDLTPREHLVFSCELRMPQDVTKLERTKRIEESIHIFGLEQCQHRVIGDIWGGLSKNERRRLCFAAEILTDPAVLFADEPTTGLDSAMAEVIVRYLRALAQKGPSGEKVTVIATIHQPSSHVFRLFDSLNFVVDGRVGYCGPASDIEAYFASIGFSMPMHTPPAEFIMKLCIDPRDPEGSAARRQTIAMKWENHIKCTKNVDRKDALKMSWTTTLQKKGSMYNSSQWNQLLTLMKRDMRMKLRSRQEMRAVFAQTIVLGLVFGLTFLRLQKTQTSVFSLNAALFMLLMMGALTAAMGTATGMPLNMPTLIREHHNGAFSVTAMYLSKTLVDLPFETLIGTIWTSSLYWMIGFNDNFVVFLRFLFAFLVTRYTTGGLGYLAGYTAPVPPLAMLIVLVNVLPMMLFGGLFINLDSIPIGFIWLEAISIFRYSYQALMVVVWQSISTIECSAKDKANFGCPFKDGEMVLKYYGLDPAESYLFPILWLFIILVVYRILAFVSLLRRMRPRQFDGSAPEDDTKGEMRAVDRTATSPVTDTFSMRPRPLMTLEWRNLTIEVKAKDTKKSEKLRILENSTGVAQPGELVAIMGPSGCGKTTLLKALADIGEYPLSGGEVLVNGLPWNTSARSQLAFMYQEELFFAGLTVTEHLFYQGRLRAGGQSRAVQSDIIYKLLAELGLTKCKDTMIGQIGSGLSGGERRRLAFGTEMLMDPSLILVDEPTSGLDSAMAHTVTNLLREVARGDVTTIGQKRLRTICATIHQPSIEIFDLFDKLIILAKGKTVYYGKAKDTLRHFESLGLECPRDVSPPDFFMRCVAVDVGEQEGRDAARVAMDTLLAAIADVPAIAPIAARELSSYGFGLKGSMLFQMCILIQREFLLRRRSKLLFKVVIIRTFVMALLLGLLYLRMKHNQVAVQSLMGAISMAMTNTFMTAGFGLTQELPLLLRPALRESKLGMYSMTAWFWSKVAGDCIFDFVLPFTGTTIMYFMIGFGDNAGTWITFTLMICLLSLIGEAWGYLCSMIGGIPEKALTVFMLTMFPLLIFNGFFINTNDVPVYFMWIEYISPFKYAYSVLAIIVWNDHGPLSDCGKWCAFKDGKAVLDFFGIDPAEGPRDVIIVVGFMGFSYLAAWLCAVLRAHGCFCLKRRTNRRYAVNASVAPIEPGPLGVATPHGVVPVNDLRLQDAEVQSEGAVSV